MSEIQINYQKTLKEVKTLNPQAEIVVVTKTQSIGKIQEAIQSGAFLIGENKVQEAEEKFIHLPSSLFKHLIGHLQTNKVNKAVQLFDLIETVDSFVLAEKINQACQKIKKTMPIFIQVNTSGESQKFGISPFETIGLIQKISQLSNLKIEGLMTIARFSDDPEESRQSFQILKKLFEQIKALNIQNVNLKHLSMGMTHDYKIALEEGSTLVRIGTRIFGKRN